MDAEDYGYDDEQEKDQHRLVGRSYFELNPPGMDTCATKATRTGYHTCEGMPESVTVAASGRWYVAETGAPVLFHGIDFCPFCGTELDG